MASPTDRGIVRFSFSWYCFKLKIYIYFKQSADNISELKTLHVLKPLIATEMKYSQNARVLAVYICIFIHLKYAIKMH